MEFMRQCPAIEDLASAGIFFRDASMGKALLFVHGTFLDALLSFSLTANVCSEIALAPLCGAV